MSIASEKPTRNGCRLTLRRAGVVQRPLVSLRLNCLCPAGYRARRSSPARCLMLRAGVGEQDRQEDRRAQRAADLAEERDRRGRHAHVPRVDRVLHGQHDALHVHAEPERRTQPCRCRSATARCRRRSGSSVSSPITMQHRADDREDLVAAGARGDLTRRPARRPSCPPTSGRISRPALVGDAPLTICR